MLNPLENLGAFIRKTRTEREMTQGFFAGILGVTPQAVSKWETGCGYPDVIMFPVIADTLGVTIDELFGRESPVRVVIQEHAS